MTNHLIFGSDHAGVKLRRDLMLHAGDLGYNIKDCGPKTEESVDYPDFANVVAAEIEQRGGLGVLICGSGVGISIAANRHAHIRAALVDMPEIARLSRLHNDANVIVFGARFISPETAKLCLNAFLESHFEGGRHAKRVRKLGNSAFSDI